MLDAELLARISRAARRGEYLYLAEPLLWLPIVPAAPAAESQARLNRGPTGQIMEDVFGAVTAPLGVLVLAPDRVYREIQGQWQQQPLPADAPLRVEHNGYSPDAYYQAAPKIWQTPKWELLNRIQVGSWPADGVIVRGRPEQQRLIALLRCWYERGVPVREWVWGQRTFLLNPRMRYEEIQAFKQQYGVSLYD